MFDLFWKSFSDTNGLYVLESNYYRIINYVTKKRIQSETNRKFSWHHRLGHIREKRLIQLEECGLLSSLGSKPYLTCESCLWVKMSKSHFKSKGKHAKNLLELIHTYMWTI